MTRPLGLLVQSLPDGRLVTREHQSGDWNGQVLLAGENRLPPSNDQQVDR
jgi:hypothetical protein